MTNSLNYRGISVSDSTLDELAITDQQVRNLIDLAYVLRHMPPPDFDMDHFANLDDDVLFDHLEHVIGPDEEEDRIADSPRLFSKFARLGKDIVQECGTSCCAVGTGAFHNIGMPEAYSDWSDYAEDAFGASSNSVQNMVWDILFSSDWSLYAKTPVRAAARILFLLIETGRARDIYCKTRHTYWREALNTACSAHLNTPILPAEPIAQLEKPS